MACRKDSTEKANVLGPIAGTGDAIMPSAPRSWKPHEALKSHNITAGTVGGDLYPQIARRAAALYKENPTLSQQELVKAIKTEFGKQLRFDPTDRPAWRKKPIPTAVFGRELIPENTFQQLEDVARSPVVEQVSLMPDGHLGYAMPIGGVAALRNAVSPSYVGYDIACRVGITPLDLDEDQLGKHRQRLFGAMGRVTHFGGGEATFEDGMARRHPVMDDPLWNEIPVLRRYRHLAQSQLGSSGAGNHFVDLGLVTITRPVPWLPHLSPGDRVAALMTHSGSRGVGHKVATHYMELAEQQTAMRAIGVPKGHGWLDMDTGIGQEYWEVMQLLGRYAAANHHLIHAHWLRETGVRPLEANGTTVDLPGVAAPFAVVENHHNFAWRSEDDPDLYIHRKGATPAENGRPGIIPGSSGSMSYLVEGRGNKEAIYSSSHGAGRMHSRSEAYRQHDPEAMKNHYEEADILTRGVAPDETVAAYKDVTQVIGVQEDVLINTVAQFRPVAVLMGGNVRADDGD